MQSDGAATAQSLVPFKGPAWVTPMQLLRRKAARRLFLAARLERAATTPGVVCRAITFTACQRRAFGIGQPLTTRALGRCMQHGRPSGRETSFAHLKGPAVTNPDPRSIDLRTWPLQPQRCSFVLAAILAQHNWRHATKNKGVSYETMEDRRQFLFRTFDFLQRNSEKVFKLDPRSFSGRHVEFLFRHYEQRAKAGTLGASSLQKFHSHLCTFAAWIGKPNLVKPIDAYISDPALYKRSYVVLQSKAWRARGIDVFVKINEIAQYDERAAAAVALMAAFGLRFKEAAMFCPNIDVVTAEQAGKPDGEVTHYLRLKRGTKGGRLRYVPISTPEQHRAIERAQRVALRDNESISDPRYTLVQAIRHLRYVMELFGVTKRALGVTPHGLRHQYAADQFRGQTGVAAAVEGGPRLPPHVDQAARRDVSDQLGHSRIQIMNAYLGSSSCQQGTTSDMLPGESVSAPQ
jgi:integrase